MRIGVGNDHAAVELREVIIEHLKNAGHEVFEFGAKEGEKCDYPVPGRDVAEAIVEGKLDKGVLICRVRDGKDDCGYFPRYRVRRRQTSKQT